MNDESRVTQETIDMMIDVSTDENLKQLFRDFKPVVKERDDIEFIHLWQMTLSNARILAGVATTDSEGFQKCNRRIDTMCEYGVSLRNIRQLAMVMANDEERNSMRTAKAVAEKFKIPEGYLSAVESAYYPPFSVYATRRIATHLGAPEFVVADLLLRRERAMKEFEKATKDHELYSLI